jgi:hypothetical protein
MAYTNLSDPLLLLCIAPPLLLSTGRNLLSGGSSPAPAPEPVPYPVPVLTPVLVPTRVPSFESTGAVGINTQIGHQASHQDATATSTQTTGHGKEGYNYAENTNDQRSTQTFEQSADVRARKSVRVRTGEGHGQPAYVDA